MNFGLEPTTYEEMPDVEPHTKQMIRLENNMICKSADPATKKRLATGFYYIAHPRITRGFIRIATSEANCDKRIVEGYVYLPDIIKLNKELLKKNG